MELLVGSFAQCVGVQAIKMAKFDQNMGAQISKLSKICQMYFKLFIYRGVEMCRNGHVRN